MADERGTLTSVSFVYEYEGHGWARAGISDGSGNELAYFMDPSYTPSDPMFALVSALARLLAYGGYAECDWFYEPAADRWLLDRDGDVLRLAIRGVRDGFTQEGWPTERGDLKFSATCDLWSFAAKLRTAVSRIERAVAGDYYDPTWVRESAEYGALCAVLDECKLTRSASHGGH